MLTLCGGMSLLTGCGGGSPDDPTSNATTKQSTPPPSQNGGGGGDLAPAAIGGKTISGHIGGTNTVFQIVTAGSTSGTYTYSENGKYLQDGDFTWVKTGPDTGVLTISPNNNTLDLNYTAPNQGDYVFHPNANYTETGTFTTN